MLLKVLRKLKVIARFKILELNPHQYIFKFFYQSQNTLGKDLVLIVGLAESLYEDNLPHDLLFSIRVLTNILKVVCMLLVLAIKRTDILNGRTKRFLKL